MARTSVYRHFNSVGELLYVGVSKNALARLGGHKDKTWYFDIATVSIEHFHSRAHALYAEAVAIRDEKPLHNKTFAMPRDPDVPIVERLPCSPDLLSEDFLKAKLKAMKECKVPLGDGPGGPVLGYACVEVEGLADVIAVMRQLGIPDTLMFLDPDISGRSDRDELIQLIKYAQVPSIRILSLDKAAFTSFMPTLNEPGVSVDFYDTVRLAQNAALQRADRARKSKSK